MEKITASSEETQKLAAEFVKDLKLPQVIALYGDLGSGKTTFVQGLGIGLKIGRRILSPTFVLQRIYQYDSTKELHHLDLYRLNSASETTSLGLDELFAEKNVIVVIEWPEKIATLLPSNTIKIRFEYLDETRRRLVFEEN